MDTISHEFTEKDYVVWNFIFLRASNDLLFFEKTFSEYWSKDEQPMLECNYLHYMQLIHAYLHEVLKLLKEAKEAGVFDFNKDPKIDVQYKLLEYLDCMDTDNQEIKSLQKDYLRNERNQIFHYIEEKEKRRNIQFSRLDLAIQQYNESIHRYLTKRYYYDNSKYYLFVDTVFSHYLLTINSPDYPKINTFKPDGSFDKTNITLFCVKKILKLLIEDFDQYIESNIAPNQR